MNTKNNILKLIFLTTEKTHKRKLILYFNIAFKNYFLFLKGDKMHLTVKCVF